MLAIFDTMHLTYQWSRSKRRSFLNFAKLQETQSEPFHSIDVYNTSTAIFHIPKCQQPSNHLSVQGVLKDASMLLAKSAKLSSAMRDFRDSKIKIRGRVIGSPMSFLSREWQSNSINSIRFIIDSFHVNSCIVA